MRFRVGLVLGPMGDLITIVPESWPGSVPGQVEIDRRAFSRGEYVKIVATPDSGWQRNQTTLAVADVVYTSSGQVARGGLESVDDLETEWVTRLERVADLAATARTA